MQELVKDKGAVIFAYPKANTTGCTKQACGFRDNYADIDKAGAAETLPFHTVMVSRGAEALC